MPFFSIVLPTYNSGLFIDETLSSLLNQEFMDYEIIIVDDGSSDDTLNRLDNYADRIRVFAQENKGAPSARNFGINKACGKYIVSFDHDDILLPHALKVYRDVIEYFNFPPIVISKLKWFSKINELQKITLDYENIYCTKFESFFKKNTSLTFMNSNMIIEKDVLLKVSGYPSMSYAYDDYRLIFRLGNKSPMIAINYPVTVGYRKYASSWSRNTDYLTNGIISLIKDERTNSLPGGKEYKFDRRGLIASNVLSTCTYYLGVKSIYSIIQIMLYLRSMIFAGFARKMISIFYKSETFVIRHILK